MNVCNIIIIQFKKIIRFSFIKLRNSIEKGYIKVLRVIYDIGSNNKLVLDVGCGKGIFLKKLLDFSIIGCGIDFSKSELKICRFNKLNVIMGDATKLPLRENVFDIVSSSQFFEHVWHVYKAINEQVKVLRKNGILIIEQVNLLSIYALINLIFLLPIKTKGKRGGLKWLINKQKISYSLYGKNPGKDEDVKSILWWRDIIKNTPYLKVIDIYSPLSKKMSINNNYFFKVIVSFFSRGIIIIAEKDQKI